MHPIILRAEDLRSGRTELQKDHIHLIVMMPPKVSVSELVGTLKGRTAIRIFKQNPKLKTTLYCGKYLGAEGYCVDTVEFDPQVCAVSRVGDKCVY